MLKQISSSVFCWSEIHGAARNEPYAWNSYVINAKANDMLALVDPLAMTDGEMQEVERIGKPTHILLTCEFHVRETQRYRDKWECRVLTLEEGIEDFEIPIDDTFRDGDQLWDLIRMIYVPDVYYPETAFLVCEDGGILIMGDLLSGGRLDRKIPDGDIGIFPDYVADLSKARKAYRKLLDFPFESMYFGHGSPVIENPKEVLRVFLDSDQTWQDLERLRQELGTKIT